LRVAFVVQRYGEEVNGGAEALCRMVAERMARHWEVEVLTTRALDYVTWEDHFQAGVQQLNGVTVRRFGVAAPRDIARFDALSQALCATPDPALAQQEEWMRAQGPWSPELFAYIAENVEHYDLFVFYGYLYATTYFGLPLARGKAVLAPFAHDEWPIHFGMWEARFREPSLFAFSTPEEKAFLQRRFPGLELAGSTIGVAVERPADIDPGRFRRAHGIDDDFILYVGRVDPSKGCGTLFDYFLRHVEQTGDRTKLVTLGRAVMEVPAHPQVVPLGFVSEQTKWDAMAACDLLVMPSPYESLSIVLLEAWSVGKPVLVNQDSDVLHGQALRSNGGLFYRSFEDFSAAVIHLRNTGSGDVLARQGFEFVNRHYRWDVIEAQYLQLADAIRGGRGADAGASQA
jgi:glycosyltransferase involved in cell wall biosynthesis